MQFSRSRLAAFFHVALILACACALAAAHAGAVDAAPVPARSDAHAPALALAPQAVLAAMERVADYQLAHPIAQPKEDQTWVDGVGYAGFMALAGVSANPRYRDAMLAAGEGLGWQLGEHVYDADDYTTGQMFAEMYLQTRDPRMLAPLRERLDFILAHPSTGTLEWNTPGVKQRWSWCDALFMGPPTWARLSAATGDPRYLDFAIRNWWRLSDFLYDKEEHLFYRDSSYIGRTEANGRKIFWGRGSGWVIAGLARTLQYMPAQHPERARLEQQFREMAGALLAAQQPDGMWRASMLDPASYPIRESSASGLILFGLAWGVNQGILPRDRFEPAVERGWLALNENVRPDGKLVKVQPIGANPKNFDPDATQVYGVGAYLLAGAELYRMGVARSVPPQGAVAMDTASAPAGDAFDAMRERWRVKLAGMPAQDRSAPDVAAQLRAQAAAAASALAAMASDPEAPALWPDTAGFADPYPVKASAAVTATAARLRAMALAYGTPGSSSYQDARLGAGIASSLDWLVRHYYTAGRREFGNWWDWQIGTPLHLLDVLTLAHDAVPADLRRRTLAAVDWHVPDGHFKTLPDGKLDRKWKEEGANLLDKGLVNVLSGMLGRDGARIDLGRDALVQTLVIATEGNGFYADGSYVQHSHVAYNGGYGAVALADYARLLHVLAGSPWAPDEAQVARIVEWARNGFAATIVDGAMPDALRGRGVSRRGLTDHAVGRAMAGSLAVIAESAPPPERAALQAAVKGWMARDRTFGASYFGSTSDEGIAAVSLFERGLLQRIAADPLVAAAPEPQGARVYAAMDRAFLRGQGFTAVVSMASPRISSFETGNRENLQPWWQGMGVLHLYDADQGQFGGSYWATIDPQRLPGTTTDRSGKERPAEWKKYPNTEAWVGGAALGKYAAVGMAFSLHEVTGSSLHGRKAWFQLGDRVLALGSGIGGGAGPVETVVDNRRLADPAAASLLIDGVEAPRARKAAARWAHLQDRKSGSRIGYVFPQGPPLVAERGERTGRWRDVNSLSGSPDEVRDTYQVLAIPDRRHAYAYLLLPGATVEATRAAALDAGVRIEANDERAAAASVPAAGVYVADLWQAGSAPRAGRPYVTASGPAAVVASVGGGTLRLAVAEPTRRTASVDVEIDEAATGVLALPPGVTVLRLAPRLKLRFDMGGAGGATREAAFAVGAH